MDQSRAVDILDWATKARLQSQHSLSKIAQPALLPAKTCAGYLFGLGGQNRAVHKAMTSLYQTRGRSMRALTSRYARTLRVGSIAPATCRREMINEADNTFLKRPLLVLTAKMARCQRPQAASATSTSVLAVQVRWIASILRCERDYLPIR